MPLIVDQNGTLLYGCPIADWYKTRQFKIIRSHLTKAGKDYPNRKRTYIILLIEIEILQNSNFFLKWLNLKYWYRAYAAFLPGEVTSNSTINCITAKHVFFNLHASYIAFFSTIIILLTVFGKGYLTPKLLLEILMVWWQCFLGVTFGSQSTMNHHTPYVTTTIWIPQINAALWFVAVYFAGNPENMDMSLFITSDQYKTSLSILLFMQYR